MAALIASRNRLKWCPLFMTLTAQNNGDTMPNGTVIALIESAAWCCRQRVNKTGTSASSWSIILAIK